MEQDRNTRINRTTTEQQSPVNNQNVTTKEQMNKNCISNRTPTEEYKTAGTTGHITTKEHNNNNNKQKHNNKYLHNEQQQYPPTMPRYSHSTGTVMNQQY
jgi:hypothetical protein